MNSAESSPVKDVTDDQFMVEVIEKSKELPVLVDFWAPWCGPCKSLTPILESVSAKKQSSIALVKVNIDENKMIASQLRVQSIPAVFAFSDGQPVDGFMGAKTESEVKDFIDNIINKYSKNEGSALENAKNLIESEEYDNAKLLLENIIEKDPSADAFSLLIKLYTKLKLIAEIENLIESIPENLFSDNKLKQAISSFELIKNSETNENIDELKLLMKENPNDLKSILKISKALFKEERFSESIDELFKIYEIDKDWQDEIAKKQLLMIFDHLGPENELAKKGRRYLTSLIFN